MGVEGDPGTARSGPPRGPSPGPGTEAVGPRSVAIAGDVSGGVIITGDIKVVQHYPALKDFFYDFDGEKRLADRFVGRTELFQRLDDFTSRSCGYIRVVADAGLGKTALSAAAARRLEAPAFFASASRGLTRPDQCLNHLAVELIARFGLAHDHLPPRSGEDSAFLGKILAEAEAKAKGPLWIVVDALDEADPPGPVPQPAAAARPAPGRGLHAPDAPARPDLARHGRRDGRRGIPHRRLRRRPAGRHRSLPPPRS
jgi:hypothetical protein